MSRHLFGFVKTLLKSIEDIFKRATHTAIQSVCDEILLDFKRVFQDVVLFCYIEDLLQWKQRFFS